MLTKAPKNELINMFAMKLSAQRLKIYKGTLHSREPILAESFKVA